MVQKGSADQHRQALESLAWQVADNQSLGLGYTNQIVWLRFQKPAQLPADLVRVLVHLGPDADDGTLLCGLGLVLGEGVLVLDLVLVAENA